MKVEVSLKGFILVAETDLEKEVLYSFHDSKSQIQVIGDDSDYSGYRDELEIDFQGWVK